MNRLLKMPRLGETMDEGKLSAWLVEPGQPFKRGDAILEVETDKTLVEFPALGDGILITSLVQIGDMIDVGTPIAEIDIGDGPNWLGDDSEDVQPESIVAPVAEPAKAVLQTTPGDATNTTKSPGDRPRATPVARRIAKQASIELAHIVGTGRRGRIERRDVESATQAELIDIQTGYGLAWCEKGLAESAPILFIHGFAADHTAWSGLQSQMARSGYRTISIDLPSHGSSSQEAYSVEELALPVIEFAENAFGSQPVHIVAHSMGAIVAVDLVQSVPTASLTLIAPAGVGRTINKHFIETLSAPRDVASVARALSRLTHGPNGLSNAAHQLIFDTLSKGRITELTHSLAGASGQHINLCDQLAGIVENLPVSVLIGHRDQVVNWSEGLDISALVSVHHFPDAGHMPHWEAQSAVQKILERIVSNE